MGKPGKQGKMGNYGCGQPNRKKHVNCLRRLLDTTPHGLTVPKGKRGLGKYGCGQPNRRKHVNCLRRLLDQHGPHLVGQGKKGGPGMRPEPGGPGPMTGGPGMAPMGGRTFDDCRGMGPVKRGDVAKMRDKKNCFRDVAKLLGAKQSRKGKWKACKQIKPRGKFKKLKRKKNCFRDLARSLR